MTYGQDFVIVMHMKTAPFAVFAKYRAPYKIFFSTYLKSWLVRLSFLIALASRLCKVIALPIIASQIIANLAEEKYSEAQDLVLLFAGFTMFIGILSPLKKYIGMLGENPIYARLMRSYFEQLLSRDAKYFGDNMTGYVTTATRQYGDSTLDLLRKIRDSYINIILSLVVPIAVIWYTDALLGIIILATSTTQAAYLVWSSHAISPYRTKSREEYKRVSGIISDAITNIIAIKSSSQEESIAEKFSKNIYRESSIFMQRHTAQAKFIAVREVMTVIFFTLLFYTTVQQLQAGAINIAASVLIVTYSFTILAAVHQFSDALSEHDDFIDKIIPVLDLMKIENTIQDPKNPKKITGLKGDIAIKKISFAYSEADNEIPVFKNLDITIPAGQKVGVVGLSGAGKSTLAKLLLRFEDTQKGSIYIDGIDIKQVAQRELRRNISYVPQEPLLFHDTIAENIRLAKMDATDNEIENAARLAHASTFIKALPKGLESIVGERGIKLSGGQKQRIAIARAVLQNAPIIILDEATSALDSESEQIIKNSFKDILRDKTAIVIAHRLSTLADMDKIIFVQEGKITEDGTHNELMKQKGAYAALWKMQLQNPEKLEAQEARTSLRS